MNPKTKLSEAKTVAEDGGTAATATFRKNSHLFFRIGNGVVTSVLFCVFILPRVATFAQGLGEDWETQPPVTRSAETKTAPPQEAVLPGTQYPMSNLPLSQWRKLQMAGGKDSKTVRIPVPSGMRVLMNGSSFRYNCVYADGTEKSFGAGEKDCAYGDMPYVYASNLSADPNVIAYAYQNIDR